MNISYSSGLYTLTSEQVLPIGLQEAWDYFSSPKNLIHLTPSKMKFEIINGEPEEMYEGQIIAYLVSIFPGFKTQWITEITHVKPLVYFIDEQRAGPYTIWHHEHRFTETDAGVHMADKVSYKLPFASFGRFLAHRQVNKKLTDIFEFRRDFLIRKFGRPVAIQ